MRFDILTIFPEIFDSYFNHSILKRAQNRKLIKIYIHNLRRWTFDRHQTVDDTPYGGGSGMIFKIEPVFRAVKVLRKIEESRIILFSVKGKKLTQRKAKQLSKYKQLILICPRYEGIDERVAKYVADEEISIGDYILTGGELPAMVLIDAVSRLIPGVIKQESLREESFSLCPNKNLNLRIKNFYYEYPQYTKPAIFYPDKRNKKIRWQVPKILLSGDHKKIQEWRCNHLKKIL